MTEDNVRIVLACPDCGWLSTEDAPPALDKANALDLLDKAKLIHTLSGIWKD